MQDVQVRLSAVWVALMLAYLLGDVLRIYAGDFTAGEIGGVKLTQAMVLAIALLMLVVRLQPDRAAGLSERVRQVPDRRRARTQRADGLARLELGLELAATYRGIGTPHRAQPERGDQQRLTALVGPSRLTARRRDGDAGTGAGAASFTHHPVIVAGRRGDKGEAPAGGMPGPLLWQCVRAGPRSSAFYDAWHDGR
jgi:hypothetical protein